MTVGNEKQETPGGPNPDKHIELLRTTPVDTVCPNFYILDHARGCHFDCSYCFLRDTEYNCKERRVFSDKERLFEELREWIDSDGLETCLANAGNMADSLTFERERPLWGELIEIMRERAEKRGRPHSLLAVTKAGLESCGAFFEHEPTRNVIVSFSVNAPRAAEEHELGAASSEERLRAAARLKEAGWRVRIRIDPMMAGYDYAPVVEEVRRLAPERVTLGTLRADPTLYPLVKHLPAFSRLVEPEPGSIWRYPAEERLALYRVAADRLRDATSLGLCEETPDMWKALGFDVEGKTCNCNPF